MSLHDELEGLLEHVPVFVIETEHKRSQYTETFTMEAPHGLMKIDLQVPDLHDIILGLFLYRFEADQQPQTPRTLHQREQFRILSQRHGPLCQPALFQRYHLRKDIHCRLAVQAKGVVHKKEVGGLNGFDLGNHFRNRPDTILLSQCLADAAEFAIVRTTSGGFDADRDRNGVEALLAAGL